MGTLNFMETNPIGMHARSGRASHERRRNSNPIPECPCAAVGYDHSEGLTLRVMQFEPNFVGLPRPRG